MNKIAVVLEFNGYTQEELQYYLSERFVGMKKGKMTASILSESGYEKVKDLMLEKSDDLTKEEES